MKYLIIILFILIFSCKKDCPITNTGWQPKINTIAINGVSFNKNVYYTISENNIVLYNSDTIKNNTSTRSFLSIKSDNPFIYHDKKYIIKFFSNGEELPVDTEVSMTEHLDYLNFSAITSSYKYWGIINFKYYIQ